MKTNLAYVEEAFERSLASPLKSVETIGGFQFEKREPVSEKRVASYREAAALIKKTLADADVTPLAVVPSQWWKALLRETGLCVVGAEQDSVGIDFPPLSKISGWAAFMQFALGVVMGGVLGDLSIIACDHFWGPYGGGPFTLSMVPIVVLSVFSAIRSGRMMVRLACAIAFWSEKSRRRVLNFDVNSMWSSARLGFRLPTPPEDFREMLLKLRARGLLSHAKYAAELRAFQFSPSVADRAAERILDDRVEARRRFFETMADPICYVEINGAVAVVGQFGDFPIEKEVVDRVAVMNV